MDSADGGEEEWVAEPEATQDMGQDCSAGGLRDPGDHGQDLGALRLVRRSVGEAGHNHWPEDQADTHQSAEEDRVRDSVLVGPEVRPGEVACPGAAGAPVEEERVLGRLGQRCLPLFRQTNYWVHGQSGEAEVARDRRGAGNSD